MFKECLTGIFPRDAEEGSKMERDLRDLLDGVREKLNRLKRRHQTNDDLNRIAKAVAEKAENQRKDVGGAYAIANDLRETSKDFIKSLEMGNIDESIEAYREIFGTLWFALAKLDLVPHFAWRQDSESGGEVAEAEGVYDFRNLLFNYQIQEREALTAETRKILVRLWYRLGDPDVDPELSDLISNENAMAEVAQVEGEPIPERIHRLTMAYQTWLAGMGDVPGELSKMVTKAKTAAKLEKGSELPDGDGMKLSIRFIHITDAIYEFLASFETCYPAVINNSQRLGWFNTYRGMLGRVAGLVNRRHEDLERLVDQEKFLAKMENLLKAHSAAPQI